MNKLIVIQIFILNIFLGCTGVMNKTNIPDWTVSVPSTPYYLFASATASNDSLSKALEHAATLARGEIARQIETKISALTKSFSEELGPNDYSEYFDSYLHLIKTIASQNLIGSRVSKQFFYKDKNEWIAYVLVECPIGEANQAFIDLIQDNDHLYKKFRASETFKQLEDALREYEEERENK